MVLFRDETAAPCFRCAVAVLGTLCKGTSGCTVSTGSRQTFESSDTPHFLAKPALLWWEPPLAVARSSRAARSKKSCRQGRRPETFEFLCRLSARDLGDADLGKSHSQTLLTQTPRVARLQMRAVPAHDGIDHLEERAKLGRGHCPALRCLPGFQQRALASSTRLRSLARRHLGRVLSPTPCAMALWSTTLARRRRSACKQSIHLVSGTSVRTLPTLAKSLPTFLTRPPATPVTDHP